MIRGKLFFMGFLFASVSMAFSLPLDELVSQAHATRLRDGSVIVEAQLRNLSPALLPQDTEFSSFVNGIMNTLSPNMLVETLYLYKKPGANSSGWTDGQRAGLFNRLVSISTMAGIQYYSERRGEMRTFFESSSVVDGQNTKNRLPDPVYTQPPAELTLHARQKDLTFGDNVYRYDYKADSNKILFTQTNVSALFYGIIPVIGSGNLKSVVAVFDCGDSLLMYSVSMVKALSVPGTNERVSNSFSNRAEAVIKWFTGTADTVFSAQ